MDQTEPRPDRSMDGRMSGDRELPGGVSHDAAMTQKAHDAGVHRTVVRVRYCECDSMGVAHHAVYPVWLEIGRTELCRHEGLAYKALEEQGFFLAVTGLFLRYRAPARYDDLLEIETRLVRMTHVKLEHAYRITRDGRDLATAETTLACLDRSGRPQPLPDAIARMRHTGDAPDPR